MKIAHPAFSGTLPISDKAPTSLIIENPPLLLKLLSELTEQAEGGQGGFILSEGNKELNISKMAMLITDYVRASANTKTILSKITASIEARALSPEYWEESQRLLSSARELVDSLSSDLPCSLEYEKLYIQSIVRALGIRIADDAASCEERLLDLMDIARDLLGTRVFILVHFFSFFTPEVAEAFASSALAHGHRLLFIDAHQHQRLQGEHRLLIDSDLCEI